MAICDMADQAGCTIAQFLDGMSAFELQLRITNRLMKTGLTFDPDKIAEIKQEQEKQQREAFMQRAQAHWSKK